MILVGIIIIVIGLILILGIRPQNLKKVKNMEETNTQTIEELTKKFSCMEEGYREIVEIKEYVLAENLVRAPFSKKEVAYYEATAYEIVEREVRKKDSNGNYVTDTETDRNLIFEENSSNIIKLKDSTTTDTVTIELTENIDIPQTYDRDISGIPAQDILEKLGMNMPDNPLLKMGLSLGAHRKRYELKEKTINFGQKMYVLGEAIKRGNDIYIVKPEYKNQAFIVSTRTEEEIVKSSKRNSFILLLVGIILIVIGSVICFM